MAPFVAGSIWRPWESHFGWKSHTKCVFVFWRQNASQKLPQVSSDGRFLLRAGVLNVGFFDDARNCLGSFLGGGASLIILLMEEIRQTS